MVPAWLATTSPAPASGTWCMPETSTRKYFSYSGRSSGISTDSVRSGSNPNSSISYSPAIRRRTNARAPARRRSHFSGSWRSQEVGSAIVLTAHRGQRLSRRVPRPEAEIGVHPGGVGDPTVGQLADRRQFAALPDQGAHVRQHRRRHREREPAEPADRLGQVDRTLAGNVVHDRAARLGPAGAYGSTQNRSADQRGRRTARRRLGGGTGQIGSDRAGG